MESLAISPMTAEFARAVSQWTYDGVYSFYSHSGEPEGLLDGTRVACTDTAGALVGYFSFGTGAQIPTVEEQVYEDGYLDLGLGLRPDLCGKGLGLRFLNRGLDYAEETYHTNRFRLSVAAFNERAVKVYERAGFQTVQEVTNAYFQNRFLVMTLLRG